MAIEIYRYDEDDSCFRYVGEEALAECLKSLAAYSFANNEKLDVDIYGIEYRCNYTLEPRPDENGPVSYQSWT